MKKSFDNGLFLNEENFVFSSFYNISGTEKIADKLKDKSVNALNIAFNKNITDENIKAIADLFKDNHTIIALELSFDENAKGFKAVSEILKKSPNITTLKLSSNTINDNAAGILEEILKGAQIANLILNENQIGSKNLKKIAEIIRDRKLPISLSLHRNKFNYQLVDKENISDMLNILKWTLIYLNLRNNDITDQYVAKIALALQDNTIMTHLNLSNNNISTEGAGAIAEMLQYNKALTYLDLQCNTIGPVGGGIIAESLESNNTLSYLNLNENKHLSDFGIEAIASSLKINKGIKDLSLMTVDLGDKGVEAIAEMLKINNTLTQLNIASGNTIEVGIKALTSALKVNKKLIYLVLNVGGAEAISEALEVNNTLICVCLENIFIDDKGAKSILKSIKNNYNLCEIQLQGNKDIIQNTLTDIYKVLERNNDNFRQLLSILIKNSNFEDYINKKSDKLKIKVSGIEIEDLKEISKYHNTIKHFINNKFKTNFGGKLIIQAFKCKYYQLLSNIFLKTISCKLPSGAMHEIEKHLYKEHKPYEVISFVGKIEEERKVSNKKSEWKIFE